MYNNSCYNPCPTGTFISGLDCLPCDSNCETCVSEATVCLTCYPGFYFWETGCLTACPDGFVPTEDKITCEEYIPPPIEPEPEAPKYSIIYFPFLIVAVMFTFIAVGGKCKDPKSLTISNMIVFIGFEEIIAWGC